MMHSVAPPPQGGAGFLVTLREEAWLEAVLEPSDLQDNVTEYAVLLAGEPRPRLLPFAPLAPGRLPLPPPPLLLNVTHPGGAYRAGLLARHAGAWSKPLRSVTILTSNHPTNY